MLESQLEWLSEKRVDLEFNTFLSHDSMHLGGPSCFFYDSTKTGYWS